MDAPDVNASMDEKKRYIISRLSALEADHSFEGQLRAAMAIIDEMDRLEFPSGLISPASLDKLRDKYRHILGK